MNKVLDTPSSPPVCDSALGRPTPAMEHGASRFARSTQAEKVVAPTDSEAQLFMPSQLHSKICVSTQVEVMEETVDRPGLDRSGWR